MATVNDIKSPVWGLSIQGGGAIAEGLASIRQCIDLIVRTTKGTDPLRPLFGSDMYKYVDYPIDKSIPLIKKAILESIALWEGRVNITSINHTLSGVSNIIFVINYKLVDGTLTDSISITVGNNGIFTGTNQAKLVLQGYFPPNPTGFQYQISLVLDGNVIMPMPPADGFASVDEMYQWVKNNWNNYGQWYLTSTSIVGYINQGYKTGSLTVTILVKKRFQGGIPVLPIGYKYTVQITVDGVAYNNDTDLFTADQIRDWAQNNEVLGALGYWQVVNSPGSFNDDFNDDFQLYLQLLVIYTAQADQVDILIDTIIQ